MKVAFLTGSVHREPSFGGEVRVYNIARALALQGIEVELIGSSFDGGLMMSRMTQRRMGDGWAGGDWYPITPKGLPVMLKLILSSARDARAMLDYDAVISELGAAWRVLLLGLTPGANTILDEHNVEWSLMRQEESYSGVVKGWRNLRAYERICHKAFDRIIAVSEVDRDAFIRDGDVNEKLEVVANGVDLTMFRHDPELRSMARSELGLREYEQVLLFMGSMRFFPNLDALNNILTRIFPAAKRLVPSLRLLIFGRGMESVGSLDQGIINPGSVTQRRVSGLINAADVCIAPLRFGSGTRHKILEWMACGKPVVATRKAVEGLCVTHGTNVMLEDDFRRYPEMIASLCSNPSLKQEIGKNARRLVEGRYDWNKCVLPLLPILKDGHSSSVKGGL